MVATYSVDVPCSCSGCILNRVFDQAHRDCSKPSNVKKEFTLFKKVNMHQGHAEQLGRFDGPGSRRFEKRRANRLRRRAEKIDPENAPIRPIYKGYSY